MIVIDDFIKDKEILDSFLDMEWWKNLDEGEGYDKIKKLNPDFSSNNLTFLEKLVKNLYINFWSNYTPNYFEYWANITNEHQILDWHQDKDEKLWELENKLSLPKVGAVWYGYPHKVWGGYLEIQNEDEAAPDFERIQPLYNRVVVFDITKQHRVAPVLAGHRFGLQINLW